jgi:hypothetical protein
MIRPFTTVTVLLAAGAGLFLYQTKHQARLLDRQIGDTIRATEAARASTGILRAEWQLLNDTERLSALAGRYLSLKPTAPTQFTTFADLASRLPAVRPPPTPETKVPGETDGPDGDGVSPPIAATEPTPAPDVPSRPTTVATAAIRPDTHAADHATPDQHAADQHPQERRPAERRPATSVAAAAASAPADPYRPGALATRVVTRPAVVPVAAYSPPPRPIARPPVQDARATAPAYPTGSSLGMAHTSSLPAPVPISSFLNSGNPANAPGGGG